MQTLSQVLNSNRENQHSGIYSVCSAHPLVIEAALQQGVNDNVAVLIEATANQVNQFGGYTGMNPKDFVSFVSDIAFEIGYPVENIIFGGDHLGPTCWTDETAENAMEKSKKLIAVYVEAGFKKIHLDTSMECADDAEPLTDEIVASRAATLCKIAEDAAIERFGCSDVVYVVGTEVPPPGGAKEEISVLEVTPVENVRNTLQAHSAAFESFNLNQAWNRVIGIVVQPGVEFDNFSVIPYDSQKAQHLSDFIETIPRIVYEAHSTDYQPDNAYHELVKDHFAILKVGPQLTFALREALFALSYIEEELVKGSQRSNLRKICCEVMENEPSGWNKFYPSDAENISLYRNYSFSDRIRYYWNNAKISQSVDLMFKNLSTRLIPSSLLSQFMPCQYLAVMNDNLENKPRQLVVHRIMQVTNAYSKACSPQ